MKNSWSNIYFQAFPPANVVFAGIGVLLLVRVLHVYLSQPILTPRVSRRLKIPALGKTSSLRFSTASIVSSIGSRYTLASHQLWL
jgi:hypothetical protein